MVKGENEYLLATALNEAWPGLWAQEYKGIEGRRFRFDAACPLHKVAIEIEGGIWAFGRHNQPVGMKQDMEKYNLAVLEGWKVLRYTPDVIRKTPWKVIQDISKLIGYPTSTSQTTLDQVSTPPQIQVKIQ